MATFPYYDPIPRTAGRELQFPQAVTALDIECRSQVAAWLLQIQNDPASFGIVYTYFQEVLNRDVTTEPFSGRDIRAYVVARNLVEHARRGPNWGNAVDLWLGYLDDIIGFAPHPTLYINPEFAGADGDTITPPNDHGMPGQNENPEFVVNPINGGFNELECTISQPNRTIFSYGMGQHSGDLEVGATYRISYLTERVEGSSNFGANLLVPNAAIGWTPLNADSEDVKNRDIGVEKRIFLDFTVDQATISGGVRFGNGLTVANESHVKFWHPRLEKIADAPTIREITGHLETSGSDTGWFQAEPASRQAAFAHEAFDESQVFTFRETFAGSDVYKLYDYRGLVLLRGNFSGSQGNYCYFMPEGTDTSRELTFPSIPDYDTEFQLVEVDTGNVLKDEVFSGTWWVNRSAGGGATGIIFTLRELSRKLLDSEGNVLTTESSLPLQHDLSTEDDMLFTDYMPERSSSASDVTIASVYPTFDPVVNLTTDTLPAGKYHVTVSFVWAMDSTNDAMIYRYTGDLASPEFHQASNDDDDVEPKAYTFPYEHAGGVFTMGMEASIDQNGQSPDIDIPAANIIIKRVG